MNIAEWSIRNSVITWVLTVLMAVVGVAAFGNLSLSDGNLVLLQGIPDLGNLQFSFCYGLGRRILRRFHTRLSHINSGFCLLQFLLQSSRC